MTIYSQSFLKGVNVEVLRHILDTNSTTRFGSMFSWAMSPQGHRYWASLRNESDIIPDEARGYLEDILNAIDPKSVPTKPYDPNQIGDLEDDL